MVKYLILLPVLSIILSINIIAYVLYPVLLFDQFEHDMTTIRPYIEEAEYYFIESDWVLMRSKEDYDVIYEFINNVKDESNLVRE